MPKVDISPRMYNMAKKRQAELRTLGVTKSIHKCAVDIELEAQMLTQGNVMREIGRINGVPMFTDEQKKKKGRDRDYYLGLGL